MKIGKAPRRERIMLTLGALGIVYGDIGTSPLYALKECFYGSHSVPVSAENILGVLSLFFWSLLLIVSVKYLSILMRAHNNGEGGIMALLALLTPKVGKFSDEQKQVMLLGVAGAALLYGDGVITPAISVLSAVEGLEVATPFFQPYIVPVTIVILISLFLVQRRGTAGIGAIFGPTMLVWFFSIAAIGVPWIVRQPQVLMAINPVYAYRFFVANGEHGFLVLSAVVLCVTGAEALYADMGHFGPKPIRQAWYRVVFPALVLNYFGQGAMMISRMGTEIKNPFYAMVPGQLLLPMVAIATFAAVIASQALISGAFSLTQQATQLGYLPRFPVVHTSEKTEGQIYVPRVNQLLMVSCIALVFYFKNSSALAGAYGIAVISTMMITTILLFSVARKIWKLSALVATGMVAFFLLIDFTYFFSNLAKLFHGGLFPMVLGFVIFVLMTTWRRGRKILAKEMLSKSMPLAEFTDTLKANPPVRVKGLAVFMTPSQNIAPAVLLHHFRHNQVLHEKVILMTIVTRHVPWLPLSERGRVTELGLGVYQIVASYGYMQTPNVYEILECCQSCGMQDHGDSVTFYLGRETLLTTGPSSMALWRKKLFAFLSRNAQPATTFFGIPPDRVMEVGLQLEV